jgi:hypothetical protein
MRESWTDERIDDLCGRVDRLSGRVDALGLRIDALSKVILQGVVAMSAAMLTGFAALFTLIATKL